MRRLHIIHGPSDDEPTYPYLLVGNNWKYLVNRCHPGQVDVEVMLVEADKLAAMGATLSASCPCDKHPLFPLLERVVMGGIRDSIWTQFPLGYLTRDYTQDLPLALVGLPSVRHYCQSLQVGPLALPAAILEVKAPLETFTYHAVPGHGPTPYPNGMPPVIIGAINRYHFSCNHVVVSMDGQTPLIDYEEVKRIMVMILSLVKRQLVTTLNETEVEGFEGTYLEFYDLIRHVQIQPPEVGLEYPFFGSRARWLADRPSKCLGAFQSMFNHEFGPWRDRIVFKNREDAPLCPACGLDQEEEWKNQPEMVGDYPSAAYLLNPKILAGK